MKKIFHILFFLTAINCSLCAQVRINQKIPSVSLRAFNGQILGWDAGGLVTANKSDLSDREFFKIHNISRPDTNPQSNDIVVFQASNGHFMFVRDDGRIGLHPDYFNPKVRFQIIVPGRNDKGDLICNLKNIATNKFVMAMNGGGSEVNNNALQARQFETFTIRYHEPTLVFIKSANNNFLCVNTPGQLVLRTSAEPPANSSFSFIVLNRSNTRNDNLFSGDTILICFRNKFVFLGSDGRSFFGTSDRGAISAQFVILSNTATPSNPRINSTHSFTLRSVQSGNFWLASDLNLTTSTTNTSAGNNFTFLARAYESLPETGFPSMPSGITSYPFRVMHSVKAGIDTVVVFKLRLNENFSIDDREINNRLFGDAPSLSTWLRDNSNGKYNVASKGIFGPFQIYPGWSAQNYDTLFTLAENSGLNLNIFGSGIWDQIKYKLLVIEPGGLWGNKGFVTGTSRRGYRFRGVVAAAGVTPDVDKASRMVMAHEISHALFDVTDRYPWRKALTGDVVAFNDYNSGNSSQKFTITKRSGSGQIQNGDQISLKVENRWVVTTINDPFHLNLVEPFTDFSWFTISTADGAGLTHMSKFFLKSHNGKFVIAVDGGNSGVRASSDTRGEFETFSARRIDEANRPILSGEEIRIVTHKGFYLDGFVNGKTINTPVDRKRGYSWSQGGSNGCGGLFDNSTSNYDVVLLNLYDRIRLGWVNQKYLTPEMKGTYLVRPYIGSGDGIILFDPMNPREWYTVENRLRMENRDEIPSSGLLISWVCEDEGYWRSLYANNRDDDFSGWRVNFPVIISANNPRIPPNPFFYPPLLNPNIYTRRNTNSTAFCSIHPSHELVLPLGNGSPSRFHVIITKVRGTNNILLTIK